MLKNIFLIVFIFFIIISCKNDNTNGFKISGTSDSYITGSTARLFRVENKKKKVLDSTVLEKGNFTFEGKVDGPDIYYITIDNVLGALPIILANETFDLQVIKDSLANSKIIGSKENDYTQKYNEGTQYLRDKHKVLNERFQIFKLSGNKDSMQTVKFSYDSLVLEKGKFDVSFIKKYPNTTLAALILERITMAKQISEEETNLLYKTLSKEMQNTRAAKYALEFIEEQKKRNN
ncbi:DUF4369 domain-containing protein [Lacinutrix sp.]|uniref:DUF4369 domain-containing protein n=1 Tax=Lacinutrix sp. TaxID=1937692 RepID=UPI002620488A|nr:DUF4369 domain-containing protein [Lacinutrix sp.]MDG1714924.1 DUF4369 domain-containing protein [Lacinutrix sp.]